MSESRPTGARAIVLGAGAGGGVPQWNCGCPVCVLARRGDGRVSPATQASLALSGNGREWVLVNASPDLRAQFAATPVLHPRSPRDTPMTDVILTGGEVDQVAGLLTLREASPFRLHATAVTHAALSANPIFDVLRPDLIERRVVELPGLVEAADLRIEMVAVAGKAPLYDEGDAPRIGVTAGETVAIAAQGPSGRRLAYVPACVAVTPALREFLDRADVILFDGTLFRDDEMTSAGLGAKAGRRMGHLPMTGPGGTLEWLRQLSPRRRYYTHVNNSNPVLVAGSPERREVEAAGIALAHDGLEIPL